MSVASKNLYELLGNDVEDSDGPAAPPKIVEKTSTHTTKRNFDGQAPASKAPAFSGSRRGGAVVTGNEAVFRDRNAGSDRNRVKPTDESGRGARGGYGSRARGGRGGRFRSDRDDRHSKNIPSGGSEKQAAQTWGATDGEAELKDEVAGEKIAQSEQKEAATEAAGEAKEPEAEPEPEDKHISYADYLAQQAEKKLALGAENSLSVRKPNEGTKENKKWANAKPLPKDEDEDYFAGSSGKSKRERERKVKQVVEIDQRYVEPERPRGGRGGRGGGRGDSFRGSGRGDSGRGRGRGGAPRGSDNITRGPRARVESQSLNTSDEAAFPSLGS